MRDWRFVRDHEKSWWIITLPSGGNVIITDEFLVEAGMTIAELTDQEYAAVKTPAATEHQA